ncbi:sulfotransferase [Thiohalocapsa marina]|uniref:Sulfotransferase n=1 Tax=Thiohalocapsa marina TaxID=424902 RepID=A0A5M8FSS3_9GAMM|nr:sulfotransferase [Thiohalocapsa marina]KAA6185782.1 sulfotransferase [Thiohalocapsa marina]
MFDLVPISTRRLFKLALTALRQSPDGEAPLTAYRVLVLLGFLPLFALVQGIHWLGFLCDDVFFRGWRQVRVRDPLFVLGVPRSGTTRLHQVLARDAQFTTFAAWECLFALSVTERRFWLALARLDKRIGAPAGRIVGWLERRVFGALDAVHPMGLTTPEEDYFTLMPILSCFILVLAFPASEHLWRMGLFDRDMPEDERRRILDFYENCLKKHLYVHGEHKRLLSKNASFAPLALSLAEHFPDARFIVCLRDPQQTIPSQLSSITPGLQLFGVPQDSAPVRERLLEQLAFYYDNLQRLEASQPAERCVTLTLPQLKGELAATLTAVYARFGLQLGAAFADALRAEAGAARRYSSGHRYTLEQFGLDASQIAQRFATAYAHAGMQAGAGPMPADRSAVAAEATGAQTTLPAPGERAGTGTGAGS